LLFLPLPQCVFMPLYGFCCTSFVFMLIVHNYDSSLMFHVCKSQKPEAVTLLLLPVGSHCFSGRPVWGDLLSYKFPPGLYASVHPVYSFLCFCLLHAGFLLDSLFYLENGHDMFLWRGCGTVAGWGTELQTRRSRVQFSMRSLDFFFFSIYLIVPAALWAWSWFNL
jgi:hypothetical protein